MLRVILVLLLLANAAFGMDTMIADITEPVESPFATYYPIPVSVDPSVEPWEIEPGLSNVVNAYQFDLTDEEISLLVRNSFVVVPVQGHAEGFDLYNENRDNNVPSFITSDVMLHTYHLLFDYILIRAELDQLYETLLSLNGILQQAATTTFAEAQGTGAESAARRLLAYHSVAACLADSTAIPPAAVADLVNDELALIHAHNGIVISPVFGYYEDYTQYIVRGHYTTNDTLGLYFKAMMWYGRLTFALCDYIDAQDHTLSGLLLARDMLKNPETFDQWQSIYWPTVFFVGRADDLTPHMYADLAEEVYGSPLDELAVETIADPTMLQEFMDRAMEAFDPPQITTITPPGLRFMGQRFIPDSYVLDQVVMPHCGRTMPKGLDVMASLGSDRALWLLEYVYSEFGDQEYVTQLAAMRQYMTEISDSTWAGNLYYNWLYSLMPLLFEKNEGWPVFMTNPAWTDRELSTSLMSWGELRHDTILYAKQSGTESAPPSGAFLNGYVEPNPYLWARLAGLAAYTRAGLEPLGLLGGNEDERLERLENICRDLLDISLLELNGEDLTPEQEALIASIGIDLQILATVEEGLYPEAPFPEDTAPSAIIADVHTDPISGYCLEEGVGYPWSILVAVRRGGVIYLTRGAFLPYYEFILPLAERMTDEEWREELSGDDPPVPPVWTDSFMDTTVDLDNPNPLHYYYYSTGASRFTVSLEPEHPSPGENVQVTAWYGSSGWPDVEIPMLSITTPDGQILDVQLQENDDRFYGEFGTENWESGIAILHFQGYDEYDRLILDWRTTMQVGLAGEGPGAEIPTEFGLMPLYPNPTSSEIEVLFAIPEAGIVELSVWNVRGQKVDQLIDRELQAGTHRVAWSSVKNGFSLPSGPYFIHLVCNGVSANRVAVVRR